MNALEEIKPGTVFLMAQINGDYERIVRAFQQIVTDSFVTHKMRQITGAEVKRRGKILEEYFRIMRGDKKWSLDRSLQEVRQALLAVLDDKEYEWPPDEQVLYGVDPGVEPTAAALRNNPYQAASG
jgi:hypothetical protein